MEPLQVIAAPRRLRILELVWDRELSAGQIAAQFEVSWSAVSQHLRVLKDAGFVVERREGTSRIYRADLSLRPWHVGGRTTISCASSSRIYAAGHAHVQPGCP